MVCAELLEFFPVSAADWDQRTQSLLACCICSYGVLDMCEGFCCIERKRTTLQ